MNIIRVCDDYLFNNKPQARCRSVQVACTCDSIKPLGVPMYDYNIKLLLLSLHKPAGS